MLDPAIRLNFLLPELTFRAQGWTITDKWIPRKRFFEESIMKPPKSQVRTSTELPREAGRSSCRRAAFRAVSRAALASLVLVGSPDAAEPPPEAIAVVKEWLEHPETHSPSIAFAAFNASGIVWSGAFGLADVEQEIPATPLTRYCFASVTKVHTALLLAQMALEGTVGIDDEVTKYFPDFAPRYPEPGARPITLRDLATHSSGLPNRWGRGWPSEEQLIGNARESAMAVQPGYQGKYSNWGVSLLGMALARAADEPYETLVRKRIMEPLGMASSGLHELYDAPDLARGYHVRDGELAILPSLPRLLAHAPASAVVSTVEDMARFGMAHFSRDPDSPVPPRAQELLFMSHTVGSGFPSSTGLGWLGGGRQWHHMGSLHGHYTRLIVRPDVKVGVAVATNGPAAYMPAGRLANLLNAYADTSELEAVCATYEDAEGQAVVRLLSEPELTLEIEGAGKLVPISRHSYRVSKDGKLGSAWVRFVEEDGEKLMLWERRKLTRKTAP